MKRSHRNVTLRKTCGALVEVPEYIEEQAKAWDNW